MGCRGFPARSVAGLVRDLDYTGRAERNGFKFKGFIRHHGQTRIETNLSQIKLGALIHTHTHTHTHIYMSLSTLSYLHYYTATHDINMCVQQ